LGHDAWSPGVACGLAYFDRLAADAKADQHRPPWRGRLAHRKACRVRRQRAAVLALYGRDGGQAARWHRRERSHASVLLVRRAVARVLLDARRPAPKGRTHRRGGSDTLDLRKNRLARKISTQRRKVAKAQSERLRRACRLSSVTLWRDGASVRKDPRSDSILVAPLRLGVFALFLLRPRRVCRNFFSRPLSRTS